MAAGREGDGIDAVLGGRERVGMKRFRVGRGYLPSPASALLGGVMRQLLCIILCRSNTNIAVP